RIHARAARTGRAGSRADREEVARRRSRESGNPASYRKPLDPRFRGHDESIDHVHHHRRTSKGTLVMSTGTVRFHRVLRAPAERIYRAFLDAEAMAKWLPPNGFTGKVHHLDAKVGGRYKMSFTNFTTGKSHSFGGKYLELAPNERIRYSNKFDDPNLPGEMQTTITLKKV